MKLADKLKVLRMQEGQARGLSRSLTQSEVARLIKAETGRSLTQAYLSQLESGKRRHLTAETREQLAKFFKVHPGYLVDEPIAARRSKSAQSPIDKWLLSSSEDLRKAEPSVSALLREMSAERNPRRYFELLAALRRNKGRLDELFKEYAISR